MTICGKVEAFYTGGGIWISAAYVDGHHYVTTDNEDMSILYMYDDRQDDEQGGAFCCQGLLWSKSELNDNEREVLDELCAELKREMKRCGCD